MPILSYMNHLCSSICSLRSTFLFKSTIIIFSAIPILSGCKTSNTIHKLNVTNEYRGIGNVDTRLVLEILNIGINQIQVCERWMLI